MSHTEKQLAYALIKACEAVMQKSPSGSTKVVTDALAVAKEYYGFDGVK
jgi:Holliday junction resolvase